MRLDKPALKESLRIRIQPKKAFDLWIEPLRFMDPEPTGRLVIRCPNHFHLKRIEKHYLDAIAGAVAQQDPAHKIALEVNPEPPAGDPKPAQTAPKPRQQDLPRIAAGVRPRRILRKGLTFDSFVVGENNQFAFSASLALASRRSHQNNVLYLLSKTGLGKTHLAQAVGHHILTEGGAERVLYISADDFSSEMVYAFRSNSIADFKRKYRRECDVLVLEDVQYLTGKERSQIEMILTLESLLNSGARLIFTSCYLPAEIPKLNPDLRSRLACGVISTIDAPEYKTRVRILEQKAAQTGLSIPMEIIRLLAADLTESVRQLEGGLAGLCSRARLLNRPIDEQLAQEVIYDLDRRQPASPNSIIKEVCKQFSITVQDIKSKSRRKHIKTARHIAMYLFRHITLLPFAEIGRHFNRSHSLTLYACTQIERDLRHDQGLKLKIEYIRNIIESNTGPRSSYKPAPPAGQIQKGAI